MKVDVRLFASLREAAGAERLQIELQPGAGFDALMTALEGRLTPLAQTLLRARNVRIARNQELVTPPFELRDGDELAFLPPVTGG